jgi:hypothetical protein
VATLVTINLHPLQISQAAKRTPFALSASPLPYDPLSAIHQGSSEIEKYITKQAFTRERLDPACCLITIDLATSLEGTSEINGERWRERGKGMVHEEMRCASVQNQAFNPVGTLASALLLTM